MLCDEAGVAERDVLEVRRVSNASAKEAERSPVSSFAISIDSPVFPDPVGPTIVITQRPSVLQSKHREFSSLSPDGSSCLESPPKHPLQI